MKLPSLLVSVIFVAVLAAINAAIAYFNVGGAGAEYIYSAIVVAILSAIGRYLQEQQALKNATVTTTKEIAGSNGQPVMRSRTVAAPVETKDARNEALLG